MRSKFIFFSPFSTGNPYTSRIKIIFRRRRLIPTRLGIKNLICTASLRPVFCVHWPENIAVKYGLLGFIGALFFLVFVKLIQGRLVLFVHNHSAHWARRLRTRCYASVISKMFRRFSDIRICHGIVSAKRYNAVYVRHPLPRRVRTDKSIKINEIYAEIRRGWFVIGAISELRDYKCLQSFGRRKIFAVGPLGCSESKYEEIKNDAPNVTFIPGFLPHSILDQLLSTYAEGLIVPPTSGTSIVSGSIYLALSYALPIVILDKEMYEELDSSHFWCFKTFARAEKLSNDIESLKRAEVSDDERYEFITRMVSEIAR